VRSVKDWWDQHGLLGIFLKSSSETWGTSSALPIAFEGEPQRQDQIPMGISVWASLHIHLVLASPSLLVCGSGVETVEYLDNRETVEVGDRKLDPDDNDALDGCEFDACLLSCLGSL